MRRPGGSAARRHDVGIIAPALHERRPTLTGRTTNNGSAWMLEPSVVVSFVERAHTPRMSTSENPSPVFNTSHEYLACGTASPRRPAGCASTPPIRSRRQCQSRAIPLRSAQTACKVQPRRPPRCRLMGRALRPAARTAPTRAGRPRTSGPTSPPLLSWRALRSAPTTPGCGRRSAPRPPRRKHAADRQRRSFRGAIPFRHRPAIRRYCRALSFPKARLLDEGAMSSGLPAVPLDRSEVRVAPTRARGQPDVVDGNSSPGSSVGASGGGG